MARNPLNVLNALDVAKVQLYHFTTIIIAGMGFFTDAYDLFCISTISGLLGRLYYSDPSGKNPSDLPRRVMAAVYVVPLFGASAGHLFFGWMGDKLGRKKVYGITLMIMVITSIASGLSFGSTAKSVMTTLCFFRFWLGFGIGGDYPLTATIMSEYANKKTRGAFIAAVFAMQGMGNLAGGAVAIIVSKGFMKMYNDPPGWTANEADYVWRIILMFGAVPAALTYYWRMKMPETARYTALVQGNAKQAAINMSKILQVEIEADELVASNDARFGLFSMEFARRHGWHLVGTTSTWFITDIAFYTQNLFQKDIFRAVGWLNGTKNPIEDVYRIARAQSIIALCSTLPGYWFAVIFVDRIGRKTTQLLGFFFMSVFMFVLALPYNHWRVIECDSGHCFTGNLMGFLVPFCLAFFFSNFGPNSTTFIVPAEIFPTRIRSTCHGISAAAGKAGAIFGAFCFLYIGDGKSIGIHHVLLLLAITNAVGFIFTFLIPETKGKSLEELSRENEKARSQPSEPARRTVPI